MTPHAAAAPDSAVVRCAPQQWDKGDACARDVRLQAVIMAAAAASGAQRGRRAWQTTAADTPLPLLLSLQHTTSAQVLVWFVGARHSMA